jgi:FixJ family two-component response regulator
MHVLSPKQSKQERYESLSRREREVMGMVVAKAVSWRCNHQRF